MDKPKELAYSNIDEYILQYPDKIQKSLNQIRDVIKAAAPEDTIEKISWGMPTFYYYGNMVHFAANKAHVGFYPSPEGVEAFKEQLEPYTHFKGTVRFNYSKPLPVDLITDMVKFRADLNKKVATEKLKTKRAKNK